MHTSTEYTKSYLLSILKKYIFISTSILLLLFFKYMHINPVLIFPIVLNIVFFYIVKYNAPITTMVHIFITILLFSIIASCFYITYNSFLIFLIMSLMFLFLTFSLTNFDIAIVYNIVLSSSVFVVHQYFGFLDVIDINILWVFYILTIVVAIFFATSRIFQIQNITDISKYLDNEIKIRENTISQLNNEAIKMLDTIDNLKIRDDITGLYKREIIVEFLHNEVIKSIRNNHVLSVACIYIKNYNTIEQLYGEDSLEKAIKKISKALQATIRQTDIIGYFDKETFICIMPHTSFEDFSTLSNKILAQTNTISIDKLTIDITIGVSSINGENYDINTIIDEKEEYIVSQIINISKQSANIASREGVTLHHLEIHTTN